MTLFLGKGLAVEKYMNIRRSHSPKTEKKKKKKKGQKQYNIKHKTKKCLTVSMLYAKSPKKGK